MKPKGQELFELPAKVAEGEWTPEWLIANYDSNDIDKLLKSICDAHNAALAAEREKWEHLQTENQLWIKRNKQLRTELSAERERYRDVANALGLYPVPSHEKLIAGIQQLRTELAEAQAGKV